MDEKIFTSQREKQRSVQADSHQSMETPANDIICWSWHAASLKCSMQGFFFLPLGSVCNRLLSQRRRRRWEKPLKPPLPPTSFWSLIDGRDHRKSRGASVFRRCCYLRAAALRRRPFQAPPEQKRNKWRSLGGRSDKMKRVYLELDEGGTWRRREASREPPRRFLEQR